MPNSQRLHKSICVPFCEEEYTTILADRQAFRAYLQQTYQNYPELFGAQMSEGFRFHGLVSSRKLNLDLRRIRLVYPRKAVYFSCRSISFGLGRVRDTPELLTALCGDLQANRI